MGFVVMGIIQQPHKRQNFDKSLGSNRALHTNTHSNEATVAGVRWANCQNYSYSDI